MIVGGGVLDWARISSLVTSRKKDGDVESSMTGWGGRELFLNQAQMGETRMKRSVV